MRYLFIGLGGFFGSILRYWLGGVVQPASPHVAFPLGTLVVNLLGCFAIGVVVQVIEARGVFHPNARVFLTIGPPRRFHHLLGFRERDGEWISRRAAADRRLESSLSVGSGLVAVWAGRAAVVGVLR